ncbi:MAG: hypothetical protein HC921_11685 [Synechococcaceae cyanobacterium SM2_3_1]|nr:hypothetical protein [Synechococcaceae cyanobacterium SM2_3_1]
MHPLTLGFAPESESEFRHHYHQNSIRAIRFSLITGLFFFAAFGLYDRMSLTSVVLVQQLFWIRFGWVCPSLLLILSLTYVPGFLGWFELANQFALLIPGCGILIINFLMVNQLGFQGLMLLLLYTYTLSRLRFWQASWIGLGLSSVQVMIDIWHFSFPSETAVRSLIFLLITNCIGLIASYQTEAYSRRDFLLRRQLQEEHQQLLEAQEQTEKLLFKYPARNYCHPPQTRSAKDRRWLC